MWVQQLAKIGLTSLNKLNTLENVADLLTKHVPRAVLDKLAGMTGYTFQLQQLKLPVFDDGENEELENDVRSSVDQTTHLTTAVLRRCVEM